VESGKEAEILQIDHPAPHFRHSRPRPQKPARGVRTQCDHDLRPDRGQLRAQVIPARRHFLGFGIPVPGRAALENVRNENIFPRQTHGGDHPPEKLSRRPYERPSRPVFLRSGGLAHENKPGLRIPLPGHGVPPAPSQGAFPTRPDRFRYALERDRGGDLRRRDAPPRAPLKTKSSPSRRPFRPQPPDHLFYEHRSPSRTENPKVRRHETP